MRDPDLSEWVFGTQAEFTMTGLVGGLASSTATTLAFSRKSKETPDLSVPCMLAALAGAHGDGADNRRRRRVLIPLVTPALTIS